MAEQYRYGPIGGPCAACAGHFPELERARTEPRPSEKFIMKARPTKKRRSSPTHKTDCPAARRPLEPGRTDGAYVYL